MTQEEARLVLDAFGKRPAFAADRVDVAGDHVFSHDSEICVRCGKSKTELFCAREMPPCARIPRYVK